MRGRRRRVREFARTCIEEYGRGRGENGQLGTFNTAEETARGYAEAAKCICGNKSKLKFAQSPPPIPSPPALKLCLLSPELTQPRFEDYFFVSFHWFLHLSLQTNGILFSLNCEHLGFYGWKLLFWRCSYLRGCVFLWMLFNKQLSY